MKNKVNTTFKRVLEITLLSLLVLIIGLFIYDYFRIKPNNVQFTNITSNSVTVSWDTKAKTSATAIYKKGNSKFPFSILSFRKQEFFDTRDITEAELEATQESIQNLDELEVTMNDIVTDVSVTNRGKYYTHHIEITGLDPETEYSFMVGDSILFRKVKDVNNETIAKTYAVPESILSPFPAYGAVRDANNIEGLPVEELLIVNDGIVYLNFIDKESGEFSNLFSSPLNEVGNWYIDVSRAIDKDGNIFTEKYLNVDEKLYAELLVNLGPSGQYAREENADIISPTEPFVINIPGNEDITEETSFNNKYLDILVNKAFARPTECDDDFNECGNGYTCDNGECIKTPTSTPPKTTTPTPTPTPTTPSVTVCPDDRPYPLSGKCVECKSPKVGCSDDEICKGGYCNELAKPVEPACPKNKPIRYNGTCVECVSNNTKICTKAKSPTCRDHSCFYPNLESNESATTGKGECVFTKYCEYSFRASDGKILGACTTANTPKLKTNFEDVVIKRGCLEAGDKAIQEKLCPKNASVKKDGSNCLECVLRTSAGGTYYAAWPVNNTDYKIVDNVCKSVSITPGPNGSVACGSKNKTIPVQSEAQVTLTYLTGSLCGPHSTASEITIKVDKDNIKTWTWSCKSTSNQSQINCSGTVFYRDGDKDGSEKTTIYNNQECTNPFGCRCGLSTGFSDINKDDKCSDKIVTDLSSKGGVCYDIDGCYCTYPIGVHIPKGTNCGGEVINQPNNPTSKNGCWEKGIGDFSIFFRVLEKCDATACYNCTNGVWIKVKDVEESDTRFCSEKIKGNDIGCYSMFDHVFCNDSIKNITYICHYNKWEVYKGDGEEVIALESVPVEGGKECMANSCYCTSGFDAGKAIVNGQFCKEVAITGINSCNGINDAGKVCSREGWTCQGSEKSGYVCSSKIKASSSIQAGEKCKTRACECASGFDKGKTISKDQFCKEVAITGIDSCNGVEDKDKVCSRKGWTCQGSEKSGYVCSSKIKNSQNNINETSLLSKTNLIKEISAEESKESTIFILDQQTGVISGITSGIYSFEVNGETYLFDVSDDSLAANNGNVLIYIDTNGNSQYDEGTDTKVSTLASEIEITTIQKNYKFNLKQGFNFVSFPFVVAYDEYKTAAALLKQLNDVYGDVIYSISRFDGAWKIVGQNVEIYDNNDFQLLPGQGYVIKAKEDIDIVIPGKPIKYESSEETAPIYLSQGWNLIGIYGTNVKSYTAKSMLQDINNFNNIDFTANNVTKWESDTQRYEGYQLNITDGVEKEYGFDYPIDILKSYFVRVENGTGNWQPELESK